MIRLLLLISFIVSSWCDLSLHNQARRAVGARSLSWSSKLASSAKKIVEWSCRTGTWAHSKTDSGGRCANCRPYGVGENIAGHGSLSAGTKAWIAEKQYWRGGRCQSGKVCGHYTQIISTNMHKVGCHSIPWSKTCARKQGIARTVCHYAANSNSYALESDPVIEEEECGEDDYDGDMCLYADGDDADPMRFSVSVSSGCDFIDKVYKHTDSADNDYFLYFADETVDTESNETLSERWLVTRDWVSDIPHFWCDSSTLTQCLHGKWTTNVFDDVGVSQEIDTEITIEKCPSLNAAATQKEAGNAVIIPVVIIVVLLVIVGASLYLFIRHRSRQKQMKQMEVIEDCEEEEEEEVTVPVITN